MLAHDPCLRDRLSSLSARCCFYLAACPLLPPLLVLLWRELLEVKGFVDLSFSFLERMDAQLTAVAGTHARMGVMQNVQLVLHRPANCLRSGALVL